MKLAKTIAKIMVALAAVAGAVYVIATYGDKIVAWAKKVLASLPCWNCDGSCECTFEADEAASEEAAEVASVAEETTPVAEEAAPVAEEAAPVAEEAAVEAEEGASAEVEAEEADFEN